MSERTNAPRSGGRAAQPRSTAGERGRGASRDARSEGAGVRGARRSDTRRSGTGREDRRERAGLRVEGEIEVTVEGTAAKRLDTAETATPALPRLRVAPPLPIRAPRPTFAAGVVALVLVGVVGILLINTKTMEQSFRLDALRDSQAELAEQQQELDQQLIQVSSPGNLEAAARRLGLVRADNPAMIRLPDGKIIRPPTPGHGPVSVTAQDSLPTTGADADPSKGAGGKQQPAAGADDAGQNGAGQNDAGQNAVGTGQ
ncbi:hypothetical protein BJY16_003275 [Actinoplanes octamycinicus]|uniref:Cell division protein FtsL n=1 Tax=Actinoplanes octamycinicus TaxID=135948 RepID=A0A7W7M7K0_9ACTN|nr:hypothetical protein [Actinoplanes octamycinicus]MBB4739816.1 hypothetical protein [Actinoplanes octamycinicus]GIE54999.1 hypothetical protein Aoc01nite_04010 [Actinoplanes octamycinicus]